MAVVLPEPQGLSAAHDQTEFNLAVWDQVIADPELAKLSYRIETNEHGQIIISPPPSPVHGSRQSRIVRLLAKHMPGGEVVTECPISTRQGVRAADVAWCSESLWQTSQNASCFRQAPEICVEVLSPSNTDREIEEKKNLYFEAGAHEVWLCDREGQMIFYRDAEVAEPAPADHSTLCPDFPKVIERS